MPALSFVAYQTRAGDTDMSQITDLALYAPVAGGPLVLYATTRFDGAVTAWAVGSAGLSLTDSAAYLRPDAAGAVAGLGFVQTGSTRSLLTGGGGGGPLTLQELAADGHLGAAQNLSAAPAFGGDLVDPLTLTLAGGAQVVYGGIAGQAGIGRLVFDAAGALTGSALTAANSFAPAGQVTALAQVTLAGTQYIFSAGTTDNGVTGWQVGAGGALTGQSHLGPADGLWIAAPTALAVATLGAQTYLVLAAAGSGSLSVMEVLGDGSLRVTDHVLDDLGSRFAGVTAMATVSHDGQTYICVGGADDGISLLQLLPGGQLIGRAHIEDTQGMGLQNISALTLRADGAGIDIFAASSSETGITLLRFEPGLAGIIQEAGFPGQTLTGSAGCDILTGGAGDDRLSGGAGADILRDGAGNDLLIGGAGADIFVISGGDGITDRIQDFILGEDRIDLSDWGLLRNIGQLSIVASGTGMIIRYGAEELVVRSSTGTPIAVAQLGFADLFDLTHIGTDIAPPDPEPQPAEPDPVAGDLVGTILSDTLTGPAPATRIFGLDGHDDLTGGAGSDSLFGGAGNDLLDGQGGADQLQGGKGDDTYLIRDAAMGVIEGSLQGGADRVMTAVSYTLGPGVGVEILQTLAASGTTAIDLTGNAAAQWIIGNAGGNVLRTGGGAADTLQGLGGDDIYQLSNSADLVIETAGQGGNDRVYSAVSYVLSAAAAIEFLSANSYTSGVALNLTGNALAQAIIGNAGINTLEDGGGAADTLTGLGGDDTYVVRNAGTLIVEAVGQGNADRVIAAVSFTLAADDNIEILQTTAAAGTGAINLTGNAGAQAITGNAGANVLDGGGGGGAADTLTGGAGNDSYVIRNAASLIVEGVGGGSADRVQAAVSFVLAAGVGVETLQAILAAGTTAIDLTGNTAAQRIIGNAGVNVLRTGGGAADTLQGLGGDDLYFVANSADLIVEVAGGGTDRVAAAVSFGLAWDDDIEFLSTSYQAGIHAINLTGNALAQQILGNAGINTLGDGGGAADTLTGLGGDDTYIIRSGGSLIVEAAGQGRADRVFAALSFGLAADDDIETVQTISAAAVTAINLTGNAGAQAIIGNAGMNVLDDGGGTGADTLTGLGGDDTYIIRTGTSRITEVAGQGSADRVITAVSFALAADDDIEILQTTAFGGTAAIALTGNDLDQQIIGNAGANRIDGRGGKDILTGGGGADRFVFSTGLGSAHVDRITDFDATQDTLWLAHAVFEALPTGALAATAFRSGTTGLAGDASDRLIYETDTGALWYDRDGTGVGTRVRIAILEPGSGLTAADIFVY